MRKSVAAAVVALGFALAGTVPSRAGEDGDHDALLRLLPTSRLPLAEGIRRAEESGGTAISAKFEVDRKGRLMLSVYTAAKGLDRDAEHNVLAEVIGSPSGEAWTPETEVFEDVPHVARAAQQHALLALSPYTLLDAIGRARKDAPGTVFSAIPVLRDRMAAIRVLVAEGEKVHERVYDLRTGKGSAPEAPADGAVVIPVEAHATKKAGAWAVEFGCSSAEEVFFRIEGGTPARVVLVAKDGRTMAASWKGKGEFTDAKIPEGFGPAVELRIYPSAE